MSTENTETASIPEFKPMAKIARLSREIIVTEKIDGTNALIYIQDGKIWAGSRTRWLFAGSKQTDNFGFASWVKANEAELIKLGGGYHYGEWYGAGIQRGYGLTEKRFALFNVARWSDPSIRPACCGVVPILYRGLMGMGAIISAMNELQYNGSQLVPGFMKPEGIVVFHTASGQLFKKTFENDEAPKSLVLAGGENVESA